VFGKGAVRGINFHAYGLGGSYSLWWLAVAVVCHASLLAMCFASFLVARQVSGPLKEKSETKSSSRECNKISRVAKPNEEAVAAAEKRCKGFVTFEVDTEFFRTSACISLFGSDETELIVGNGKGRKGSGGVKKKKATKDKLVDIAVVRTQAATKVMAQVRFIKATLEDALKKATVLMDQESTTMLKFKELKSHGVPEARILVDASLELRDQAGIIKCMYTLDRRMNVVEALQKPLPAGFFAESRTQ
jgi:hypothetical protein